MKPRYNNWLMSERQHGIYWRLFGDACAAQGAKVSAAREHLRRLAHARAFGREGVSAKDIDQKKMFDSIKSEFLRLAGTLDADDQQRKRLVNVAGSRLAALSEIVAEGYIETLLKDRFKVIPGVRSMTDLSDKQLTQLIITCNNRIAQLSVHPVTVDTSDAPF